MEASIPQRRLGQGRGHRLRGAVLRHRRGRLHHRPDDRRRRRAGAARVAGWRWRRCSAWSARPSRSGRPRSRRATGLLDQIAAGRLRPGERLGAERELAERLGVSRSTIRAALADLERGGVVTADARPRRRHLRRRAQGRARPHQRSPGSPPTCAARASSPTRACSRPRTVEADAETAAALGLAEGALRARGRARAARRRRADLARARAVPGRALPRPARPLARRLALRAARRRTTASRRGRPRSASRSWPAGAAEARLLGAAPRRAAARRRAHGVGRRRPRVRALARPVPRRPRPDRGARALRAGRANPGGSDRSRSRPALDRFVRSWFNCASLSDNLSGEGPHRGEGDAWPPPSRTPGSTPATRAPSSRCTRATRASIA